MTMMHWDEFRQPVSVDNFGRVLRSLGDLSRWLLNDAVLQIASEIESNGYWVAPPTLPTTVGSCWVLIVNADTSTHSWLKPSFMLPLVWIRNSQHGSLPTALLELANKVVGVLSRQPGGLDDQWGLHIYTDSKSAHSTRFPECNPGQFHFPSGWVVLAAGLMAAQRGVAPQGNVWATGCWDESAGVVEVSGIEQKIRAIEEYVRRREDAIKEAFLFVPSSNVITANRVVAKSAAESKQRNRVAILTFPSPQSDPKLALSSYLARLRIQPVANAPIESHLEYYRSILADNPAYADQFYQEHLYPMVVEQCRVRLKAVSPMPTRLVTVVSPSSELVRLAIEVFEFKECVMLYTVPSDDSRISRQVMDMTRTARRTKADCESLGCTIHDEAFSYDAASDSFRESLAKTMQEKVARHFRDAPPNTIAYDMVSAHKVFNYAFDHAVAEPGSLMYWIDHVWIPEAKKNLPLTERFVTWRVGENWLTNRTGYS